MNSVDTQALESHDAATTTHEMEASDSSRRTDALSDVVRAQALVGNAALAGAALSGGLRGAKRSVARASLPAGASRSDGQHAAGNSAVHHALRAASVQAKLSVSQPGDPYEQEADRVAAMVTRMPVPAATSENTSPTLQRKPLFSRLTSFMSGAVSRRPAARAAEGSAEESHEEISGALEGQIGSTRGGGQPLSPSLRSFFEPRFGADFGGVRVHTGDDAVQMNREVGARAFSHGSDIYFGDGNSPTDLELTAHELTHVLQQTGDGTDVMRAAPAIQRAPVTTNGGTFDTTTYTAVSAPTGAIKELLGADIKLEFTANDLVESTKIGMIQSVKAMKSSAAGGTRTTVATGVGDPEEGQLIMGPGQADPGREIDRTVHRGGNAQPNTSPIYGVHNSPGNVATALGHGTPTTLTSQWGSHTKDPITGAFLAAVPARIDDKPRRQIEFVGQTYEHTFESAAVAVEGPIPPNTYLGSVSWGWRSDAAGQVTLDPLTLVQAGPPSAEFMAAAARWNAATFHDTGTGAAASPVNIPTTTFTSVPPSSRTTGGLIIQIARLTTEIASLPAGTDKVNKEFEKRVLEAELARRADQPTLTLPAQEAAAALLSTPDLIRRSDALPGEIAALAPSPPRTNKELEQEAVKREIAKRRMIITVHVHETEDVIGSDSVYVTVSSAPFATRSSVVDLNNGQEHTFVVPLSTLFLAPLTKGSTSVFIRAYDEDWEGDDLMFEKEWTWATLPAGETQSRDGGRYTVQIDYIQLR
jgi:hypothetical protein